MSTISSNPVPIGSAGNSHYDAGVEQNPPSNNNSAKAKYDELTFYVDATQEDYFRPLAACVFKQSGDSRFGQTYDLLNEKQRKIYEKLIAKAKGLEGGDHTELRILVSWVQELHTKADSLEGPSAEAMRTKIDQLAKRLDFHKRLSELDDSSSASLEDPPVENMREIFAKLAQHLNLQELPAESNNSSSSLKITKKGLLNNSTVRMLWPLAASSCAVGHVLGVVRAHHDMQPKMSEMRAKQAEVRNDLHQLKLRQSELEKVYFKIARIFELEQVGDLRFDKEFAALSEFEKRIYSLVKIQSETVADLSDLRKRLMLSLDGLGLAPDRFRDVIIPTTLRAGEDGDVSYARRMAVLAREIQVFTEARDLLSSELSLFPLKEREDNPTFSMQIQSGELAVMNSGATIPIDHFTSFLSTIKKSLLEAEELGDFKIVRAIRKFFPDDTLKALLESEGRGLKLILRRAKGKNERNAGISFVDKDGNHRQINFGQWRLFARKGFNYKERQLELGKSQDLQAEQFQSPQQRRKINELDSVFKGFLALLNAEIAAHDRH